jgi:ABC-2 type transport system ATP-binding protein
VFGFLGPNGAGKTTTIRMMMGILVPSGGQVLIDGLDCHAEPAEVKRRVGYLPDTPIFYDYLRGREILQFVGEMHGYARRSGPAQPPAGGIRPAGSGRRLRRQLLAGHEKTPGPGLRLIHDPAVLILDEPINGLDPRASRDVQERLLAAAARGVTIFVSTHLLDMAEKLCDRVGIIHHGQLVATGTLDEIRAEPRPAARWKTCSSRLPTKPKRRRNERAAHHLADDRMRLTRQRNMLRNNLFRFKKKIARCHRRQAQQPVDTDALVMALMCSRSACPTTWCSTCSVISMPDSACRNGPQDGDPHRIRAGADERPDHGSEHPV